LEVESLRGLRSKVASTCTDAPASIRSFVRGQEIVESRGSRLSDWQFDAETDTDAAVVDPDRYLDRAVVIESAVLLTARTPLARQRAPREIDTKVRQG
jgi:hypothetical protein